jgi:hypothetical protein
LGGGAVVVDVVLVLVLIDDAGDGRAAAAKTSGYLGLANFALGSPAKPPQTPSTKSVPSRSPKFYARLFSFLGTMITSA